MEAKIIDYFTKVMTGPEYSGLQHESAFVMSESKRLKCVQIEPIRIKDMLYFVVTAVDEDQDGSTGFLELIILKYQPTTDAPITRIWRKRLNKEPISLNIRDSSLWVQNSNIIYCFEVENDLKGKQVMCRSNSFDLSAEKESVVKLHKIKMAMDQQNQLLEGMCIIFAKQGLAQEEMNLNEHAEADKLFMKRQVVMLIARPRMMQKKDME